MWQPCHMSCLKCDGAAQSSLEMWQPCHITCLKSDRAAQFSFEMWQPCHVCCLTCDRAAQQPCHISCLICDDAAQFWNVAALSHFLFEMCSPAFCTVRDTLCAAHIQIQNRKKNMHYLKGVFHEVFQDLFRHVRIDLGLYKNLWLFLIFSVEPLVLYFYVKV